MRVLRACVCCVRAVRCVRACVARVRACVRAYVRPCVRACVRAQFSGPKGDSPDDRRAYLGDEQGEGGASAGDLFSQLDLDGDRKVTWDEFKTFFECVIHKLQKSRNDKEKRA